jgi:hypothetical protein
MSEILTDILEELRIEYIALLTASKGKEPLLSAERLCAQSLKISSDQLARIIKQDSTLLAARANDLIKDEQEAQNPSAGLIITMNIYNAALELLLEEAVSQHWLNSDDKGVVQFDNDEIDAVDQLVFEAIDFSNSSVALENVSKGGVSVLNKILMDAESEFLEYLASKVSDAYSLAVQVAGGHSVFAPQDIAPLIDDNPLLLALRADDLIIDEAFESNPPAGIIISSHITQLLLDHLLELAAQRGELAHDSQGQLILPDTVQDKPAIH